MKTICPSCKHEYRHAPTLNVEFKCDCGYPIRIYSGILQPRVRFKPANHWISLHTFAFNQVTTQVEKEEFIKQWIADIPKHTPPTCNCKETWEAFNFVFDTSSDITFQESTVEGHNLIRHKLNQSIFTYEKALKFWKTQ